MLQLRMLAVKGNPFSGHLDPAGFPSLDEVKVRSATRDPGWRLLYHRAIPEYPKLTIIGPVLAIWTTLWPSPADGLQDIWGELCCSELHIYVITRDLPRDPWSLSTEKCLQVYIDIDWQLPVPHLLHVSFDVRSDSECLAYLPGSCDVYKKLLQKVRIKSSA